MQLETVQDVGGGGLMGRCPGPFCPLGPTPGSSVVLLPRPVDVVEERHGEGHAQELRRRKETVKRRLRACRRASCVSP